MFMPLPDKTNHLSSNDHKNTLNNNAKLRNFGVKIVVNTLVIKQDISKVKFTKPTELRTQLRTQLREQLRTQLCNLVKMLK